VADTPFVDTHIHFHDLGEPTLSYSWLLPEAGPHPAFGNYDAIKSRRYWADDFLAETRFHNVAKVIHVQAALGIDDPTEETRWLQAFADRLGVPEGIVASADLSNPDVGTLLERHAGYPNVRGIRDLRYDDYLLDEAWQRGYGQLERFGFVLCDDRSSSTWVAPPSWFAATPGSHTASTMPAFPGGATVSPSRRGVGACAGLPPSRTRSSRSRASAWATTRGPSSPCGRG